MYSDVKDDILGLFCYGEDVVWISTVQYTELHIQVVGIFDGHGDQGRQASLFFAKTCANKLLAKGFMAQLRQDVYHVNFTKSQELLSKFFQRMDQMYKQQYPANIYSGTTASIALILTMNEYRRFVLTANVGDSPIFLCRGSHIYEHYQPHIWENSIAYKEYYQHCLFNHKIPSIPVIGRFNIIGSGSVLPRTESNVEHVPFTLYKKGEPSLDVDSIISFQQSIEKYAPQYIGGTQSLAKMVYQTSNSSDTTISSLPGYVYKNWGSVVYTPDRLSSIQMSKSLGDFYFKDQCHLSAIPFTMVTEIFEPCTLFLCSDGITDILYKHQISNFFFQNHDSSKKKQSSTTNLKSTEFWEYCVDYIDQQDKNTCPFKMMSHGVYPSWDDCSFIIVKL